MEQVTIHNRVWNVTERHSLDFLRAHDLAKFADSLEARGFCATLYLKGKRQGSALAYEDKRGGVIIAVKG